MTCYQATDTLTEDDLIALSRVFPTPSRPQLVIVKNLLNDRHATYRTYENGMCSGLLIPDTHLGRECSP